MQKQNAKPTNKYHAFEIATEKTYHVGIFETEEELVCGFEQLTNALGEVDSHSIGMVEASNTESAIDKIRAGQWSYSQRL